MCPHDAMGVYAAHLRPGIIFGSLRFGSWTQLASPGPPIQSNRR